MQADTLTPIRDLKKPLVALVLGALPFFLFIGSTSTTTVNGEVVQNSSFNILGLVLAVVGLLMAVRALVERGSSSLRAVLCVVAAILCAVQVGITAGFYTLDDVTGLVA